MQIFQFEALPELSLNPSRLVMATDATSAKIPIHVSGERGLIFDIKDVKRLREEFHVCGTLIGILPQIPQQNVFQGLPLELMPEEIRFLIDECDAAYLVDDGPVHELAALSFLDDDREALQKHRKEVANAQVEKHQQLVMLKRQQAIEKKASKEKSIDKKNSSVVIPASSESGTFYSIDTYTTQTPSNLPSYDLYEARYHTDVPVKLTASNNSVRKPLPVVRLPKQTAYDMYTHLQGKEYYLSPGLRFGGQFLAYPGDPLRYHSHHIAIGYGWNEKFNVLDVVGGGRLGTAVKKCWYVGAKDYATGEYHGFSVEWSGFG